MGLLDPSNLCGREKLPGWNLLLQPGEGGEGGGGAAEAAAPPVVKRGVVLENWLYQISAAAFPPLTLMGRIKVVFHSSVVSVSRNPSA